ncbi:MAG: hypothetical protein EHM61_20525 [Acidobacteria bacterium]|nr:MAG: hypothetical protein EHM61_20525 [Acidobacteriota bacterium]
MVSRTAPYGGLPVRLFLGGVLAISIALVVSAIYGYTAMVELRSLYLQDRAHQVETFLIDRLRGPDRLNPDMWRQVLGTTVESGPFSWLKHAMVVDDAGRQLATAGTPTGGLFQYKAPIRAPGRGFPGGRFGPQGRNPQHEPQASKLILQIGIDPSSADFITRQAYLDLAIAILAVLALSGLAYSLLRTLRSFLRLRAQEESQRHLAAIGTMSATLAHEIRNPLGAIKGLSQVTQERLPQDHATQELISTVVSEAERLERLVTDLLSFARPRAMKQIGLDLKPIVSATADGLRPQALEKQVRIVLPEIDAAVVPVLADPDGLRQVLYNVMINALDASPPGGSIAVTIDNARPDVAVEVSDEGPGFEDRDPEQFFQPFVTTKTRGTGLGLAVSRQILDQFGGRITFENRLPKGTTCRIFLSAAGSLGTQTPEAAASQG